MAELKQITVRLTPDLEAFWERKKVELRRQDQLSGKEDTVSNTTVFQGLVAFWRALDIDDEKSHKSSNQSQET